MPLISFKQKELRIIIKSLEVLAPTEETNIILFKLRKELRNRVSEIVKENIKEGDVNVSNY